jgi:hypothetical protein
VLVDSDASVTRSWTRWAERYGLDAATVLHVVHGRRAADTVVELLPEPLHAEALDRIHAYELADAAGVAALPGAREITDGLPPTAWAVVTSGTSALAAARLAAAGIVPPAVLVTADDVPAGKPAPDGYRSPRGGWARRSSGAWCSRTPPQVSPPPARRAWAGSSASASARSTPTPTWWVADLRQVAYDPAAGTVAVTGPRLR